MTFRVRHAVMNDRWDKATLTETRRTVSALHRARRSIRQSTPTGGEALDDAFWLLHKAAPELVPDTRMRESHLVNRAVAQRLSDMATTRRLRSYCVGDPFQAAMACVSLGPTLESVFDRLAEEQKLAELLESIREQIDALVKLVEPSEGGESDENGESDDGSAAQALSELTDSYDAGLALLKERLSDGLDACQRSLRQAITSAVVDASEAAAQATAWGVEPGSLQRLPADERLRLAATLNTDKVRRIAALFGRLKEVTLGAPSTVVGAVRDEIVDIELGGDLDRVVASELLLLGDPDSEPDFLARWGDRSLMQYAVEFEESTGRGALIVCIDSSMSMQGQRELWAKAFMLVLLHLAHRERRAIHVLHFGSPGVLAVQSFVSVEDFTPGAIVQAAEVFLASGTDFETPLTEALRLLCHEHAATGRTRSDVVFITDGECYVSPEFLHHYLAESERMQARTWGLDVTGHSPAESGPLASVCAGRVLSIHDLRSGDDVAGLFRLLC